MVVETTALDEVQVPKRTRCAWRSLRRALQRCSHEPGVSPNHANARARDDRIRQREPSNSSATRATSLTTRTQQASRRRAKASSDTHPTRRWGRVDVNAGEFVRESYALQAEAQLEHRGGAYRADNFRADAATPIGGLKSLKISPQRWGLKTSPRDPLGSQTSTANMYILMP